MSLFDRPYDVPPCTCGRVRTTRLTTVAGRRAHIALCPYCDGPALSIRPTTGGTP